MKRILLLLIILLAANTISFAQKRFIARGAKPGELYLRYSWYGIINPSGMYYDTLQTAIYRLTENGKKLTIQYDIDFFAYPGDTVVPYAILADATSGVVYAKTYYSKNSYPHTSLWTSFDYGKSWLHKEENIGQRHYYSANFDGVIYRTSSDAWDGAYRSDNYGTDFTIVSDISFNANETGFDTSEFLFITGYKLYSWSLYHTYDLYQTSTIIPIDSQFVFGCRDICPDVYRGGIICEVYVSSWFPDDRYRVSFSADTGHTFRHVYVSDVFPISVITKPFFMSDREPGVFYIVKSYQIEDFNPFGHHTKVCIEYYRDYGETLVGIYCHDLHKNYGKTCEAVNDLVSEKINEHSILLTWSEPESSLPIIEYQIYRNEEFLLVTTNTTFLDENLEVGVYEYSVVAHYEMGCVAESSNHVKIEIEVGIDEYLQPNFTIIPNPATNQVTISSATPFHSVEIINFLGQTVVSLSSISNTATVNVSNLNNGVYFVRMSFDSGSSVKKLVKQ